MNSLDASENSQGPPQTVGWGRRLGESSGRIWPQSSKFAGLVVALGVGAAVVGVPAVATADTTESGASSTSSSADSSTTPKTHVRPGPRVGPRTTLSTSGGSGGSVSSGTSIGEPDSQEVVPGSLAEPELSDAVESSVSAELSTSAESFEAVESEAAQSGTAESGSPGAGDVSTGSSGPEFAGGSAGSAILDSAGHRRLNAGSPGANESGSGVSPTPAGAVGESVPARVGEPAWALASHGVLVAGEVVIFESATSGADDVVAPVISAAPPPTRPTQATSGLGAQLLSWLGFGDQAAGDSGGPSVGGPLMWLALGFVRRDFAQGGDKRAVRVGGRSPDPSIGDVDSDEFRAAAAVNPVPAGSATSIPASASVGLSAAADSGDLWSLPVSS